MALQMLLTRKENGFYAEFPESYMNISNTSTNNENVNVSVQYFADEQAYVLYKEAGNEPMMPQSQAVITNKNFSFASADLKIDFEAEGMELSNLLKKACYLELKNLPEFEQAIDC